MRIIVKLGRRCDCRRTSDKQLNLPPFLIFLKLYLKLFSYIPLPSSAYHKVPGLWNNLYQILQATPKNGGCGSSGFPACGNKPVSCCKLHNNHSCDHLHVLEFEILLLKT